MKKFQELYNRFISEESAALDQWISVLVLAILAIIIFISVKPRIINMMNSQVDEMNRHVNNMY